MALFFSLLNPLALLHLNDPERQLRASTGDSEEEMCRERETKQRPSQRDAKIRQRSAELNNAERAAPPAAPFAPRIQVPVASRPGRCALRTRMRAPPCARRARAHAAAPSPPCAARRARRARPRANKAARQLEKRIHFAHAERASRIKKLKLEGVWANDRGSGPSETPRLKKTAIIRELVCGLLAGVANAHNKSQKKKRPPAARFGLRRVRDLLLPRVWCLYLCR